MKIAVHHPDEMHKDNYAPRWAATLRARGVEPVLCDLKAPDVLTRVDDCDGVMWHWYHMPPEKQLAPKILDAIELGRGLPVFPNMATRWHFDEKISQFYLLGGSGFPLVRTWLFLELERALSFLAAAPYPLVFKLSSGAGSANVLKVDDYLRASRLSRRMFKTGIRPYSLNPDARLGTYSWKQKIIDRLDCPYVQYPSPHAAERGYVYFQEFLPGNDYDIRVTVIGDRAFGYIRYNRPADFRASGSGSFNPDPGNIPMAAVAAAHAMSAHFGFQSMAYDFLMDGGQKPCLTEISYCYVNWMVQACPGYWDRNLVWHAGQLWPEEAHVDDFIVYVGRHGKKSFSTRTVDKA